MAKSKDELTLEYVSYQDCVQRSREAMSRSDFDRALSAAVESFDFIAGMMQYEKREHDKEFDGIESIDLVFQLAPPMLRRDCLDAVGKLLKQSRRVERDTRDDLAAGLERAYGQLDDAADIWDSLVRLGSQQWTKLAGRGALPTRNWKDISERWVQWGCLEIDESSETRLVGIPFRPSDLLLAICPACGAVARGPLVSFLSPESCPRCGKMVEFVLTDRKPRTGD